jgi:hypothetical protein
MSNFSIAVQPKLQVLSNSADFKQELETNQRDSYDPFKRTIDILREVEREAYEKRRTYREAQECAEKEKLKKQYQQYYGNKAKEEYNLYLAYMFLADREKEVEFIPKFNQREFIEAVSRILIPGDLKRLSDKVHEIAERVKDELDQIEDDPSYHQPDPRHQCYTKNEFGSVDMDGGDWLPSAELLDLETESIVLSDLAHQLNAIVQERQEAQHAQPIKQTLEA